MRALLKADLSVLSRAGLHTALFYAAFFMMLGVHMPFWPLWLSAWGLSAAEVGLYAGLAMAARMLGGLMLPTLADRLGHRRLTVAAASVVGAALFLVHLGIESRGILLLATLGTGVVMAGIGPIAEALGLAAARSHGFAYAHARALGSAGFLLATLLGGVLIGMAGPDIALWSIVGLLLVTALLAVGHPGGGRVRGQPPPRLGEIGHLITTPVFVLFALTVAMGQASHGIYYAFGTLHWQALGLSEGRIGVLWATGVAAEILFMLVLGAALVRRMGPIGALALAGWAGVLRWGAMALDPTGGVLWPLQALHALTFAAGHLGAMAFLAQAVPARYGASAQGVIGGVGISIGLALGMAAGAAVYPWLGGGTYLIGAVMAGSSVILARRLARRWDGAEVAV